jgi:hypothetical protein
MINLVLTLVLAIFGVATFSFIVLADAPPDAAAWSARPASFAARHPTVPRLAGLLRSFFH